MKMTNERAAALLHKGNQLLNATLRALQFKALRSTVILFGAGEGGRTMKTLLEANKIPVSFFTDNAEHTWGTTVRGIPVLSPQEAVRVPHALFVISAGAAAPICRQLKKSRVRWVEDTLYLMHLTLPFRYGCARHLDELSEVRSLLRDARSLETFDALLHQTFALDPRVLSSVYDRNQYFWSPRFSLRKGEVMVDAGAYTGDTLRDVLQRFGRRFKAIHCFEPNGGNLKTLRRFVREEQLSGKVVVHHCGLSDRQGTAYFSGSGLGYHVTSADDGSREAVFSTTIDRVFRNARVDFIKMDIEGAEPRALTGAVKVVQRDRPRLAICVYHAPEHLWKIPLMLARTVSDYSFFIRHHSLGRYETVWYAR